MAIWEKAMMFSIGGTGYVGLELLWRGRSDVSMFLAGGACFLLLGGLNRARPRLPLPARSIVGAGIITGVELLAGMLVNQDYRVWDYRGMPFHYHGQICLPFSLLWVPVSLGALLLYDRLEKRIEKS